MPTLVANTIKPTSGDTVTFSDCNVSIGGTLTYEDVTNIDAVGIVTARSGIEVLSGVVTAIAGAAVTYYGDGSNLTGVELGTKNFVASGTISNGATVVLNTDGTVGIVTQTSSGPDAGTPVVFDSDDVDYLSSAYDPDTNRVVITYRDRGNSYQGTAIVGTVSGTSISFGSSVVFESGNIGELNGTVYDTGNDKIVIAYSDGGDSNKGKAIVGTVSGTSISFGTAVDYESGYTWRIASAYESNSGKVVIAYSDGGNSSYGTAIVGTVSGTSISFGSAVVFNSANTQNISISKGANDKVVIAYGGTAIVGTISGTSISFGTAVAYESDAVANTQCIFDSTNDKVVVAYNHQNDSNNGKARVGTVSGTDISFGSSVLFGTWPTQMSSAYDSTNDKVVVTYADGSNSQKGTVVVGTVSGTDITFTTSVVFAAVDAQFQTSAYDSTNDRVVTAYRDNTNYNGRSVVYDAVNQATNLTTENYIGIAGEAIANAATGKVTILGGVNSGQSGLTIAKKYYVAPTGILTTTAGTPSVVAGTSISNTKLLVR